MFELTEGTDQAGNDVPILISLKTERLLAAGDDSKLLFGILNLLEKLNVRLLA